LEEEDGKGRGNEAVWCGTDLRERVCGELRDGEELVLGDEALGAAVELAEALVERHDLLLRDFNFHERESLRSGIIDHRRINRD
jgi:hypothetical protein